MTGPGAPRALHTPWLGPALGLALAAAVSLGIARFSYALLLPPMRTELGWSYATGGAMNTLNAAGYLLGALSMPRALARWDARTLMLGGGAFAAVVLALHGLARSDAVLYALRIAAGVASAASFVGGGVLAARLASQPTSEPTSRTTSQEGGAVRPGLVLGLYYGGTGLGIICSALLVPAWLGVTGQGWPAAWVALGGAALLATAVTSATTRGLRAPPAAAAQRESARMRPLAFGLAGYLMFGMGYIGYMTFIISLLREQGLPPAQVTAFYVLLGVGVVASSWLWAGLLQRQRGGGAMAVLNGLLALATGLLVFSHTPLAVYASGALFGSVFLSVVASTTALVRHSLPPSQWPSGIAAFTVVFACGQIVGPVTVGWVADGAGGLWRGLACSAAVLALGSALAWRQKPVMALTAKA